MDSGLKHRVIGAGLRAIAASRADRWLASYARGLGVILMFHHVRPARADPFRPNAILEVTPEHLDLTLTLGRQLGFEFVGMDEIPERLGRRAGGPPFAAVTFDDGYRDNAVHAHPILARHGVPWTMFVTTDYASGRGRLWWIELEEVVRRSDRLALVVDGSRWEIPAGTMPEKNAAFATAYSVLRAGPEDRLRDTIAGWGEEVRLDPSRLVQDLCLGWDEIRDLAEDGRVTIGAHTHTHPILAKESERAARDEIEGSRAAIADRLGRTPRHLAYPLGDRSAAGRREFEIAAQAGFATAVTTRPGHLFAAHAGHLRSLPRVSVNGLHQSADAVRALYSGVPFLAWNRGRRMVTD